MKKTFKVVMLPTKKSTLILNKFENRLSDFTIPEGNSLKPQHLYILSDEKIKEGDWCIREYYPPTKGFTRVVEQFIRSKADFGDSLSRKKIVATTDKSLYPKCDGKCTTNECVCLLPQIPESFIQAYIKAYNEGKPITEVDLEMEQIPLTGRGLSSGYKLEIKTRPDNTIIVHQSKMYSRSEVENYIALAWATCSATTYKDGDDIGADCESWINTHLK